VFRHFRQFFFSRTDYTFFLGVLIDTVGPNFVWTGCRDPLLDGAAQLATGGCLGLSLIGLPKW
jgi:hypothetical protein